MRHAHRWGWRRRGSGCQVAKLPGCEAWGGAGLTIPEHKHGGLLVLGESLVGRAPLQIGPRRHCAGQKNGRKKEWRWMLARRGTQFGRDLAPGLACLIGAALHAAGSWLCAPFVGSNLRHNKAKTARQQAADGGEPCGGAGSRPPHFRQKRGGTPQLAAGDPCPCQLAFLVAPFSTTTKQQHKELGWLVGLSKLLDVE